MKANGSRTGQNSPSLSPVPQSSLPRPPSSLPPPQILELVPQPFESTVQQLVDMSSYHEALALCEELGNEHFTQGKVRAAQRARVAEALNTH